MKRAIRICGGRNLSVLLKLIQQYKRFFFYSFVDPDRLFWHQQIKAKIKYFYASNDITHLEGWDFYQE